MSLKDRIMDSVRDDGARKGTEDDGRKFIPKMGGFFNRNVFEGSNVTWGVMLLFAVAVFALYNIVITIMHLFG